MTSGPVLVTGATGLLGSQVVPRLREAEVEVQCVSRSEEPSSLSHRADLSDAGAALEVVASISPRAILHLAGTQQGAPSQLHADNVLATANLMQAAARVEPRPAIVVVGSAAEYGAPMNGVVTERSPLRPVGEYGRTKAAASMRARELADRFDLRLCIARPFNVVSPALPETTALGNMRSQLVAQHTDVRTIRCGRLDVVRDFVPLEFVVDVLVGLFAVEQWPDVLNICTGVGIELGDLLHAMAAVVGANVDVSPVQELVEIAAPQQIVGDPALLGGFGFECWPTPRSLAAVMMADVS